MNQTEENPRVIHESLPTRESLLSRLKDLSAEQPWREFFETYWKLIYNLALRSGLSPADAEDVVQETMICVSQEMPAFRYDPQRGSFKGWLKTITSRRISDRFRARSAREVPLPMDELATAAPEFEQAWEEEWQQNLIEEAVRRVKARATPRAFQVYAFAVLQQRGVKAAAKVLNMSIPAVYMATHKVKKLMMQEIKRLEKEGC